MVHLAKIVHISCTQANTFSKRTEARFHMIHVIKEFYRVRLNLFLAYGTFDANHTPILHED